ncbi:MAG: hypothetical protein ACOY0T_35150 [Myxococcota bacterium]
MRSNHSAVRLRAVSNEPIIVRGPRSGWRYEFSPAEPVQAVAMQDAAALVATGLFVVEAQLR